MNTIFSYGQQFYSNFSNKTNILNNVFASICTLINDIAILPSLQYKTNALINSFCVDENVISSTIKSLNPKRAYKFVLL